MNDVLRSGRHHFYPQCNTVAARGGQFHSQPSPRPFSPIVSLYGPKSVSYFHTSLNPPPIVDLGQNLHAPRSHSLTLSLSLTLLVLHFHRAVTGERLEERRANALPCKRN